jgi:flagellar hook assembly protein FlgD
VPGSERASAVTVAIYDCRGRRIRTLQAGDLPAGIHHLTWDGQDHGGNEVASGIYCCEVRWQDKRDTRQLVLLR